MKRKHPGHNVYREAIRSTGVGLPALKLQQQLYCGTATREGTAHPDQVIDHAEGDTGENSMRGDGVWGGRGRSQQEVRDCGEQNDGGWGGGEGGD